tara:strand:+ start:263 stop:1087 length:825 start_codon:yes stop_codon:yes gene_type:complete
MPTYFNGGLIFVHIPKCAGTSVRKALHNNQLQLFPETKGNATGYRQHESLIEIKPTYARKWGDERFEQVPIVSTVRHPIDRAISWWKYGNAKNLENFLLSKQADFFGGKQFFDARTSFHPYVTPKDCEMYHLKIPQCHHATNREHVEEFGSLSFHDYMGRMTTWKETGCEYPSCPYHALAPQVDWLRAEDGKVPRERLSLFIVDRLSDLQSYLPDLTLIRQNNASGRRGEDYRDHLTSQSLSLIMEHYAEDFELYESLKSEPHIREPIYFSQMK